MIKLSEQALAPHRFHCVGCGSPIPWDGKGAFSYTCRCGATLFADENHNFALPASLIIGLKEGRELPHLDYYLGISNYVSLEKQKAYEELKEQGCVWSWECDKCKEQIIRLRRGQLKEGMLKFDLHPELKALLE